MEELGCNIQKSDSFIGSKLPNIRGTRKFGLVHQTDRSMQRKARYIPKGHKICQTITTRLRLASTLHIFGLIRGHNLRSGKLEHVAGSVEVCRSHDPLLLQAANFKFHRCSFRLRLRLLTQPLPPPWVDFIATAKAFRPVPSHTRVPPQHGLRLRLIRLSTRFADSQRRVRLHLRLALC